MACGETGLLHERRNSIANALELRLSCTNPSRYDVMYIYLTNITYEKLKAHVTWNTVTT